VRTATLTTITLIFFAANSLLTRGALGHALVDAPGFTIVRLLTGAIALAILLRISRARSTSRSSGAMAPQENGSWLSALWLAGYAVGFTLAYVRIGASVGALLLFGAVQVTMIGIGIARGERLSGRDWLALGLASSGLILLTLPGATAPDLAGAALMLIAGACWGAYSMAGRGARDPLGATAGNFWRATILAALALGWSVRPEAATPSGIALATLSGAVTSGVGYTIWYTVLPVLGAWRAALLQVTVPVLTGLGAALILGEPLTQRLLVAAVLVGFGVYLSTRRG
jgi:drug/metabolite transporter (DMT)-like permease